MTVALVAVGGMAGVLARYGITKATLHSDALIWSTVGINVAVFSTFSAQIVLEVDGGRTGTAIAYLLASVIGGIAAAAAGYALGRALAA